MKRLRSTEDLNSCGGEKPVVKDWGRREEDSGLHRSSSFHRSSSYYKSSENSGRKGVSSSSSSRYDRVEDDRDGSRFVRKRPDYDMDSYDRRKSYDRARDGNERGILSSSPRPGYGVDRMHRSESFSGPRRDFPKGFRSERDRSRREGSVSSWRRFGVGKDADDGTRSGGSDSVRGSRVDSEDAGRVKSPQGTRDAKSPAWSKDSGSEQSKSVEVRKSEDLPVESGGPSSDREEGELEPEPQPVTLTKSDGKDKTAVKLKSSKEERGTENCVVNELSQDKPVEQQNAGRANSSQQVVELDVSNDVQEGVTNRKELQVSLDTSQNGTSSTGNQDETMGGERGSDEEEEAKSEGKYKDVGVTSDKRLLTLPKEQRDLRVIDLDLEGNDTDMASKKGFTEESEVPLTEETPLNVKDKGKSVVSFSNDAPFQESTLEVANKSKGLGTCGDTETEGPITRGFEFFSSAPIRKQEKADTSNHDKPKDDKLALELSLSLPNVLLPIGAQSRAEVPGSSSRATSAQSFGSFRTNSDGFTASMSFSGSQQFTHNPSCSLTHNENDFEQSVKSRPLFQGVDWNALAADENKNNEVPAQQGMVLKGNVVNQLAQSSQGNSSGQAMFQHVRIGGGSSKLPIALEKQLSFNKHSSGAPSVGSHESGPDHWKDRRQAVKDRDNGSLHRVKELDGKDQMFIVGADFAESIVTMIVSEPVHTMAQRFNDMTGQHVAYLKEFVRDIISNSVKQWQLSALQKALQKRSDITLDMLVKSHRTQLEILVALKTGLPEFLQKSYDIPASDLAEIFLNMRCRNLACKSLLPVDECDCRICSQRNGFCRECMCLVCSKFDMASNTCSWVGCDVCLHWCHADCGLRESHIRNGHSATGAQGTTEMQFHCVACDRPSEMFGFVKEVFQNFIKVWSQENLSRELDYVRKIFSASKDVRGKRLHELAMQMLSKVANGSDLQEVRNHIMKFFTEPDSDPFKQGNSSSESRRELPVKNQEGRSGSGGSSQGAAWLKSAFSDKAPYLEHSASLPRSVDFNGNDKYAINMDLRRNAEKEPVFDELESIVRIKQAESRMFQARADDARKEAEALKRIAMTKNERIEEEYSSRIAKLHLVDTEEMRKRKVEELQAVESAYQEYFNMKMRMESDIKDLLLKMEATRRNMTT